MEYSNLIDLKLLFVELDCVIIKIHSHFPNYYEASDIDIITINKTKLINDILDFFKGKNFNINVIEVDNHFHVDLYSLSDPTKLNLKLDIINTFDVYKKFKVEPDYISKVIANAVTTTIEDIKIPKLEDDLVIRYFEYIEYPHKLKHLEYINKYSRHNYNFIKTVNQYSDINKDGKMDKRFDVFMIWGNGIQHKYEIIKILREKKEIEILTIHKIIINDVEEFIKKTYTCDTVPWEHLIAKSKYLLKAPKVVYFILVVNHNVHERYFDDGEFRHIQCAYIKEIKEEIRNLYNPRKEDGSRTDEHAIHATDYESQVDYLLQTFNLSLKETYLNQFIKKLEVPFYLSYITNYCIKNINIDGIYAYILEQGPVKLENTPHFKYVNGEKQQYENYIEKHLGIELTNDHTPKSYDNLIKKFDYQGYNESIQLIIVQNYTNPFIYLEERLNVELGLLENAKLTILNANKGVYNPDTLWKFQLDGFSKERSKKEIVFWANESIKDITERIKCVKIDLQKKRLMWTEEKINWCHTKYQIIDGVHRICILKKEDIKNIKVAVIKPND